MGEGFGDFLAGMYYIDHGNATYQSTRRYCIGDWDATGYNDGHRQQQRQRLPRWIDGTDEVTGADIGAYSRHARPRSTTTAATGRRR